jgi:hypothetical protein
MSTSSPELNASPYGLVPMDAQESQYMRHALNTLIQYISGAVTLDEAEKAWGEVGENHVPKDPKMPVVSRGYFGLGHGFIIHLKRKNEHAPWTRGELSFRPGEPRSYYEINMPKDYFKNLDLENVETQVSPVYYEKGHKVHIFTFKFKAAQSPMRLAFYADSMYADPKDGYPKNFDNIEVFRLE